MRDFWISSGYRLLASDDDGEPIVTPDFLRAFLSRPELQPVEESCAQEIALYEALQHEPEMAVTPQRLGQLADADARENYELVLSFRDILLRHPNISSAYIEMIRPGGPSIAPLFLSQLVHVLLRHILRNCTDPVRLRSAEIFFRTQNLNTSDGIIMLADEEIVEMYAAGGGLGGLGQLLATSDTPMRSVELDVLDEDNKDIYWDRCDKFDTVVDFRFTQPALDAFARVMEAWLLHFTGLQVRIQPMQRIDDERWSWHIGLDAEATRLLNGLYEGVQFDFEEMQRIVALFRMDVRDRDALRSDLCGKPIYLGLAAAPDGTIRMKPQNLIMNMPLAVDAGARHAG